MKLITIFLLITIGLISSQCKKPTSSTQEDLKLVNIESIKDFDCQDNVSGSLTLCTQKKILDTPTNTQLNYLVYEKSSGVILVNDSIYRGSVKWYDAANLSIFMMPGTMRTDQDRDDFTSIYNVYDKLKVDKKDYQQ